MAQAGKGEEAHKGLLERAESGSEQGTGRERAGNAKRRAGVSSRAIGGHGRGEAQKGLLGYGFGEKQLEEVAGGEVGRARVCSGGKAGAPGEDSPWSWTVVLKAHRHGSDSTQAEQERQPRPHQVRPTGDRPTLTGCEGRDGLWVEEEGAGLATLDPLRAGVIASGHSGVA